MSKTKLDFNLSASTINSFVACPWAFKQDKILKRKTIQLPSAALVLGQAFHKLLEMFYAKSTWKTYDLFRSWEQMFETEVKIQNAKGLTYLKYAKASGFSMIKNWVAMAKENGWMHEPYAFDNGKSGVEFEFLLPYDNDRYEINVHGFIDLVIEVNGKIYILDWKSGKHHAEDYFRQGVIYSWGLYKAYGIIEDRVRFVHPAKKVNEIIDVVVKNQDYHMIAGIVEEMFDAIASDNFEKRRDEKRCKWCKWVDCPYNVNKDLKTLTRQEITLLS